MSMSEHVDKYKWLNTKSLRSIDQLRLWDENPRLNPDGRHISIADYVDDLIADKSDKDNFYALLKSIATEFIPADPIVVWQDKSNLKYYVAEGNRRVLALKLLRAPEKAPKSIRSYVRNLSTSWTPIEKIMVNIAPSFEDAEWYINQRNSMSTFQSRWSRLQQQKWIISLYRKYGEDYDVLTTKTSLSKGEIESFIRNLHLLDLARTPEVKGNLTEDEYIEATSHRFPITILERFFSSSKVKESWGIEYDGTSVKLNNRTGFLIAFSEWIKNVVSKRPAVVIDTRTVTSNLKGILNALPTVDLTEDSDQSVIGNQDMPIPQEEESKNEKPASSPKQIEKNNPARKNLIPGCYSLETDEQRLNSIFLELKKLPVSRYPNAAAAMMRIFLDLAVLDYIQTESLEEECKKKYKAVMRDIPLKSRVTFLAETKGIKGTSVATILTRLTNESNEFSLDVLNGYQHSKSTWSIGQEFMNNFWDSLFPLFQKLLVIKEKGQES